MKVTAIVLDPSTRGLRFSRLKRVQTTRDGTVVTHSSGAAIIRDQVWLEERWRGRRAHRKFVLLREGSPEPLKVSSNPGDLEGREMDDDTFKAAIQSNLGLKFMRKEWDWKLVAIALLGLVTLGLIAVVYSLVS